MASTCIFCGGGPPFTREHLLPDWAARLIGVGRLDVTGRRLNEPRRSWQSVGSFGTTVKQVCKACNGGWMSMLENLAIPILSPLIKPTGMRQLVPDEQVVVASWLWKLAIVHEALNPVRYFTRDERRSLPRGDAPPSDGVRMWIGHYGGTTKANLKGGTSTFSAPDGRSASAFLLSMTISRFAAQLLCVRELPGGGPRGVPRAAYDFSTAETRIWPEWNHAVRWPKTWSLNQEMFDLWHRRWNAPLLHR
jgi:hypothetical protein